MKNNNNITQGLRKSMEFYHEIGFEYLPVKEEDVTGYLSGASLSVKPGDSAPLEGGFRVMGNDLKVLQEELADCSRCKLSSGRKNVVFGEGKPDARIMFIGEGPGREEDIQARPFVGDAGKLLTNLIVKLGLKREDVYIANIVKCRPPYNRNPEEDEISTCISFVKKQIDLIKPDIIVCLGRISAHALLEVKNPIGKMRGNFFSYNGIPVMPTLHPAYLLRNPKDKWLTWDDMQKVLEKLK
jgi:DNA polymerase